MKKDLKIFANTIEKSAQKQIDILCSSPLADNSKIRIMPDVHAGTGCTIGTTMTITDKICPNLVGVDIGCGMLAVKTSKHYKDIANFNLFFQELDGTISALIPSGPNICSIINNNINAFGRKDIAFNIWDSLSKEIRNRIGINNYILSIGTLGGGNHFIELDVDSNGFLWLIIHTGSRKLGLITANYYQSIANDSTNLKSILDTHRIELINELKKGSERYALNDILKLYNSFSSNVSKIIDSSEYCQLSYLTDDNMKKYFDDISHVQEYAKLNREIIAQTILDSMNLESFGSFHTVHNYIESGILRKGSVDASKGKMLVIPMNMQYGTLLCEGLGNPDWNYSAPHGAGRLMSRSEAFKKIDISDYKKSMENIHSISVNENTIDESPMVYKNPEEIIELIKPTCKVIDILKPIYNFKASDEIKIKKKEN